MVSSNIVNLLSPRGLAYWITDFSQNQNKGLHLNTYGFEDVLNLKRILDLENMLNSLKCSQKGERIYIGRKHGMSKKQYISVYN